MDVILTQFIDAIQFDSIIFSRIEFKYLAMQDHIDLNVDKRMNEYAAASDNDKW